MVSNQQKIYSLVLTVLSVFTFTQCAKSQETSVRTGSYRIVPAIQGTATGEIEPFILNGDDLKTQLSLHPAPKVWLAFPVSKSKTQSAVTDSGEQATDKVELPVEAVEIISSLWKVALMSRYKLYVAEIPDSKSYQQEMYKIANAGEAADRELRKLEINAPDGKRKISEDEAGEIIRFINISAVNVITPFKKRDN